MASKKSKANATSLMLTGDMVPQAPARPAPNDFNQKILRIPDINSASSIAAEQAGLLYDKAHIEQRTVVENRIIAIDKRYDHISALLESAEAQKAETKPYVKGAARGADAQEVTGFADWHKRDLWLYIGLIICFVLAAIIGAANVYTNLMASGTPVFLDQPLLAIALSLLVPLGSIAVKFAVNFFSYASTRKRYALTVYGLTLIGLLAWSAVFAESFQGVGAGLDWDTLGETSGKPGLLVWLQIVVEMLIASSLFLAADEIYATYFPTSYSPNPEYVQVCALVDELQAQFDQVHQERNALYGELARLDTERQIAVNEALADLIDRRTRANTQY